ncbi:RNA polymerase sigma-70 factor [Lysobacter sp. TAF61]|uniref:RNA polymerase sigma-70 factor n=1 Tax=Lysobacter sp. TAF61 TaxID=3233072 RepID=UPI003F985AE7
MEGATDIFTRLQPRLLGVAYRMLGSVAEAEDVVQDVWLGWHNASADVADPEAWLVTTTTRRAIDRLRKARSDREHYVGIWLPEPVLTEGPTTPEQLQEASSDLSIAFLTVLERLAPEARAAFLLREVFDADYGEIAATLDKSEAACRQIVHRAKSQLREERPRYVVSADAHQRLMRRFAEAWNNADFHAMKDMMAESATLVGDGGGIVTSFPKPMVGGQRIAQLLFAGTLRRNEKMEIRLTQINGRMGVLRYFDGKLESAQSYDTDGERITQVFVQRNPEKLRRIAANQSSDID